MSYEVRYVIKKSRVGYWYGSKKPTIGDRYLAWLTWALLGYAVLGRGFAYLGVPPVFIGEITLAFGLVLWLLNRFSFEVFRLLPACFLAGFVIWNGLVTLPYISQYGVDTLRDAASWGYALFALVVATLLIARPERLRFLLDRYKRFILIFAVLAPAAWLLDLLYGEAMPRIPGTPVGIIDVKAGDILVHLAGTAAFLVTGLGGASLFVVAMLCVNFPLTAFWNRGGMIAFLASFSLVTLLSPFRARVWFVLAIFLFAAVTIGLVGVKVQLPGKSGELEISPGQLVSNVQSVFSEDPGNAGRLNSTKEWRLEWWSTIVGYTFGGDYFLTGKGYGVNLAQDDDFSNKKLEDTTPLRSPHSVHMTFLARSGVPGFALWLLVQLTWAAGMLIGHLRSRDRGERRWAGVFLFLLAYWVAFMINASFDVFLEGPMGGIWFWTVYGVGLAAMWIYQRYPETLSDP